jgi:hypothetical protein
MIETAFLDREIDYTGEQLRSHFVREAARIRSDGVVAFRGACAVTGDALVDLEDRDEHASIIAEEMLHFIGEHFTCPLPEANFRLRLFVTIAAEVLRAAAPDCVVTRRGDDLFIEERKLSVAIATVSAVSAVFHCGINIDPSGAPVAAVGLAELGVDPEEYAQRVLDGYAEECRSIELAVRKVRGV